MTGEQFKEIMILLKQILIQLKRLPKNKKMADFKKNITNVKKEDREKYFSVASRFSKVCR